MANLKYYDPGTEEWKTLVIGKQGPAGPTGEPGPAGPGGTAAIASATAPEDTTAIWYNTENGNSYIYYDNFWTSISGLPSIPTGGTTGQVLAKSSDTDYATDWVAPGKILQVVSATTSTQVDSTSTSYVTTGLSATITPSSTSSKIAIFAVTGARNANITSEAVFTIFRGTVAGTDLASGLFYGFGGIYNPYGQQQAVVSIHIIDSPNTTSAQTYTLGMRNTVSGGSARAQNGCIGSIILMEVAG